MPCSYVVGYRRFGGPCCLHNHIQGEDGGSMTLETLVSYIIIRRHNPEDRVKMEVGWSPEMLVSHHNTTR